MADNEAAVEDLLGPSGLGLVIATHPDREEEVHATEEFFEASLAPHGWSATPAAQGAAT